MSPEREALLAELLREAQANPPVTASVSRETAAAEAAAMVKPTHQITDADRAALWAGIRRVVREEGY
jgi:hypothetical protein